MKTEYQIINMRNYFSVLAAAMCFSAMSVSAQSASENNYWADDAIKASAIVYAGANVLEPAPIYGAAIGLNCYFLRAEFEIGGSWIDPGASFSRKQMLYFSPSFGLAHTFQKKYEVYLMSSWINWGSTVLEGADNNHCGHDVFEKDLFHWRLKAGTNIAISKRLFVNVDVSYMFPKSNTGGGYIYYDNLSVRAGIGYRF